MMMHETYVMKRPQERDGFLGIVGNALTGRWTACYRDGFRVVVGEPLCSGCDTPIADAVCKCGIDWSESGGILYVGEEDEDV